MKANETITDNIISITNDDILKICFCEWKYIYIYVEECNNTWRNSETKRSYYKYIKKEEERKHYAFLYSVRTVKKYHVMRYFEQTRIVQILWYRKMYLTKPC